MTHHLGPQSKHYTIKFWAMPRRRGGGVVLHILQGLQLPSENDETVQTQRWHSANTQNVLKVKRQTCHVQ